MTDLDPKRWREIETAFDRAIGLGQEERRRFLDELAVLDPFLRQEVVALLAADSSAPAFLDSGAAEFAAPALAFPETDPSETAGITEGMTAGSYRVGQEIGRGGMSRVFLGERIEGDFERRVAIKVLSGAGLSADDGWRRFDAERRILAALDHPSIARVLDGGKTATGLPYLVLELVDGLPLNDFCRQHELPLEDRLRLILEVCSAVDFAHQRLIVHRDLKPTNILVTAERGIRLLDFGIAKLLEPTALAAVDPGFAAPLTRTGLYLMTPEYAAPEQIRGRAITTATDIYALGVVLYELITGRLPYDLERKTPAEVEQTVCEAEPERPSTAALGGRLPMRVKKWAGQLKGDLDTIVLKALRKEPEERYPSVRALADDIERFLTGLPITARPATVRYRARKFVRRHSLAVAAASVFIVALTAFGTTMMWQRNMTRAERDRARSAEDQAAAINRFLVEGLLESAAPEVAQGREISVLEAAARRVEGSFESQPALEAPVRRTLGRLYLSHGKLDEAELHLERARELTTRILGSDHRQTLDADRQLGEVLIERGEFAAALEHLGGLASTQRSLLGDNDFDTIRTEAALARAELEAGRYEAARSRLLTALASFSESSPESVETRLELDSVLLDVYARQRRWADVEEVADELLELQRRHLGPSHPAVATTLAALGQAQTRRKRYPLAEATLKEALALRQRVLGDEHPATLDSIRRLARLFWRVEDFETALSYARLDHERAERALGADHPWTIRADQIVGIQHSMLGHHELAEPIYRRTAAALERAVGLGHPDTRRSYRNLATLLRRLGDTTGARRAMARALASSRVRLESGDRDPTFLADYAYDLTTCLPEDLRAPREALPLAREAVESTGREWADGLDTLALIHHALGNLDEAIALQREVLALPAAVASMDYERRLLEYLEERGNLAAAEEALRIQLARRIADRGPEDPIRGVSHRRLGINFAKRGLWSAATAELQRAVGIFEDAGTAYDFQLWRARSELGEMLLELGRYAEAETLLAPAAKALAGRTWFEDDTTCDAAQERLARLRRITATGDSTG